MWTRDNAFFSALRLVLAQPHTDLGRVGAQLAWMVNAYQQQRNCVPMAVVDALLEYREADYARALAREACEDTGYCQCQAAFDARASAVHSLTTACVRWCADNGW